MLKSGRSILLKDEVTCPSEAVTNHRQEGEQDYGPSKEKQDQEGNDATSA
jgi:hypothetical protein